MQENTILLVLMCIGASFVQRVSGFGFGIFIMTVLPYLMPSYGEATTLSGLCASSMCLYIVISHWKYTRWNKLWYLLIIFLITSFFAVFLSNGIIIGVPAIAAEFAMNNVIQKYQCKSLTFVKFLPIISIKHLVLGQKSLKKT